MTAPLIITQSQAPALHLFHLNPAQAQARLLAEAPTPATIAAALGLQTLPPGGAEVIRLADIEALGLRSFLETGLDVRPEALAPLAHTFAALHGHVLIVHPRIASTGDVTLYPGPGLVPLGSVPQATAAPARLQTPEPARMGDHLTPQTSAPANPKGGAAVLVLLVLIVALIAFVVLGVPLWPF